MKTVDYMLDEMKRLNRMNDLLEKKINTNLNSITTFLWCSGSCVLYKI